MNQPTSDTPPPQTLPTVAPRTALPLATVGQFAAVVIIWSFTPLAAVWTVREIHWAWGLFIRFSLALPIAWGMMQWMGITLPLHAQAIRSYVAGALGLFGSMTLCYIGAQHVPSAVISMIFGLSPMVSGLLAVWVMRTEKFSMRQRVALAVSVLGMALALGLGQANLHFHLVGILTIGLAMLLYVLSTVWVRQVGANIHPFSQTLGATLVSWLGYVLLLPFYVGEIPQQLPSQNGMIALLYSAVFSSVVAMLCYYALIRRVAATTAMLTTVITPVLATLWGLMLNHEQLGQHFILGLLLLCLGLAVYSTSQQQR